MAKSQEFKSILAACINTGDPLIFGTFAQLYSLIVKNSNFQLADQFEMNPTYILEEFDRNVSDHPYASIVCLNILGVYMAQSEEIYHQ